MSNCLHLRHFEGGARGAVGGAAQRHEVQAGARGGVLRPPWSVLATQQLLRVHARGVV
jgi:hypothetical protein